MIAISQDITQNLIMGVDVGSSTTKTVVIDARTSDVAFRSYRRHHAQQAQSVLEVLGEINQRFPHAHIRMAMTGSGGTPVAHALGIPYVQEVIASSLMVKHACPETRTAIELGGQDAKMVFFSATQDVSDMRMNGSCAGGTGAFLDEIATLLHVPVEEFDELAAAGRSVYDISGRCGVYAKTDIQPLLNRGTSKEDIALSSLHAVAKQTIGGLAQGLDIIPPVVFMGGPLTFNKTLVQVFAQRLELSPKQIIIPSHGETAVAYGAALSLDTLFADQDATVDLSQATESLTKLDATHAKYPANCSVLATAAGSALETANRDASDPAAGCKFNPTPADVSSAKNAPIFATQEELEAFRKRHALPARKRRPTPEDGLQGTTVYASLGIDSGSTTTKFALVSEDGQLVDSFYAPNEGDPLNVAKKALITLGDQYEAAGVKLVITSMGTTGYGEQLFARAFHADTHVIETVAHAKAVSLYDPHASFILDIGGQDMKAIWLEDGIITNILVNEACSSGCGSFLETFASNLHIAVPDIADAAFSSKSPADLGSRCTVFMNSNIVTEQKNGKTPPDIMAGLCRSIIENVFTKVIRSHNTASLGDNPVVQGGTFLNDAVVACFEQYIGKQAVRPPYPELMGAIGAAVMAQEDMAKKLQENPAATSTFIGLDALDTFSVSQEGNLVCRFCANQCNRTVLTFDDGSTWITGNRCPKGEVLGNPQDPHVRKSLAEVQEHMSQVPDLFAERERLLFADYPTEQIMDSQGITIGLPRVLMFWDTAPFWNTFWKSLGFQVAWSPKSTQSIYESGLSAVTSDTVCFPAKLVHGHIRSLAKRKVDRIFMPSITTIESENTEASSFSLCAVVKGYPMVIRNSDNPETKYGIPFDNPLWHWYTPEDRERQLCAWVKETFNISEDATRIAIAQADNAQKSFRNTLVKRGQEVMDQVQSVNDYAVVLASRPYQNDSLVNHQLPEYFTNQGIPVLTADSIPGATDVDLSNCLIDIANNYHARMLSSAIIAAKNPNLEYVQVVSFGCGHDAYLSDEIIRLMKSISGKTPLILKLDESDIQGPLRIRVRSFIETVNIKRQLDLPHQVQPLADPYPQKFTKADTNRTVLVPNTSHAFSMLMAAAFKKQGLNAVSLPVGRDEAIRLGKQYVHNDICFPCQVVIGEIIEALKSDQYDLETTAVMMAKYVGDCRLTHYTALLRKALDASGFEQVPIITNDETDARNIHPGFKMSLPSAMRIAYGLPMIDALEELLRKIRPYELIPGSADAAFEQAVQVTMDGMGKNGISGAKKGFKEAINIMSRVSYDRATYGTKPKVLIVGEYLLNFHPGANHDIERYLEANGMEIIEARMTDVIRKSYFYKDRQNKEYHLNKGFSEKTLFSIENNIFNLAHDATDKIAKKHPLYQAPERMQDLVQGSDSIIHHTFDAGEGVLIPAEIIHHANNGCKAFVILQPFGCLPNHVVGRGISKKLKELYPDAQILSIDFDPDAPLANIENRLQMLILNTKNPERN